MLVYYIDNIIRVEFGEQEVVGVIDVLVSYGEIKVLDIFYENKGYISKVFERCMGV